MSSPTSSTASVASSVSPNPPSPSSPSSTTSATLSKPTSFHTSIPPPPDGNEPSQPPSIVEGARTIHAQDLLHVHEMPCARNALLVGIGAGFGLGGLHYILRSRRRGGRAAASWASMNWFVGAWALGSIGAFQFCRRRRELEKRGIGRAVEIMEKKRHEKEEEMRRARDEVRARRREEEKAESERRAKWWGLGSWILPRATIPSQSATKRNEDSSTDATESPSGVQVQGRKTPGNNDGKD